MYKKLFLVLFFLITALNQTQFAAADFRITNGSATETAWVVYSYFEYEFEDNNWPEGWRTQGWYKVEPGTTRNLFVPAGRTWVYIRVERDDGEVKPPDHATRESPLFWIHPRQPFTVVETDEGVFLKSDRERGSLEQAELYLYRNGGSHTIKANLDPVNTNLDPDQIYNRAMRSVVWIENLDEETQGSGALIDEERKLVVTNEHVVGDADLVFVSFPVQNENGQLIENRNYYHENYLSLVVNGSGTWARVIAKNEQRDLAILQLDFLPENSREIDHDFKTDLSRNMRRNEVVHILGNPGRLVLWRWTPGHFQADTGDWIVMNAAVYHGNSGGPVLNGQGKLIGIVTRSNLRTRAWAVPARYVEDLLDTVRSRHTFRIENHAPFQMHYQIKWSNNGNWKQYSLNAGADLYHWLSDEDVSQGFPQIRFDAVVNDGRFTPSVYTLDTLLRYFGNNYRDHVFFFDAYGYIFDYNSATREINIYRSQNEGCVPRDVNGDGRTDLRDLDFIGQRIGTWPPGKADVDLDGDVDVSDIIFAAGLCITGAAPSINQDLTTTLTVENLQLWINEAKQLDISDPVYQKGISVLEQLLTRLKRVERIPKETTLLANYPNPFNPETWIPYKLSKPAEVTVTIYSAEGRLVRTLALGHQRAGVYQSKSRAAYWDGKNELGEPVASGVYFYTLKAGDFTATRKMLIRK